MFLPGVEPRSVGVALGEGLWDFWGGGARGITSADGFRDWGGEPFPLLNYTLVFALQLRKSTENLSQSSRIATGLLVGPTWLSFEGQPRLACCTSVHVCYPEDFSQPSIGTSAFQVPGLRGSPHQLTSSRKSVSALIWSAKDGIPKSSGICRTREIGTDEGGAGQTRQRSAKPVGRSVSRVSQGADWTGGRRHSRLVRKCSIRERE
jgi:hypothetical protein